MARRSTLLQWIGHSDLRAMAAELPDAQAREVIEAIGGHVARAGDLGPTKTLLKTRKFDSVTLISNYDKALNRLFSKWIGGQARIIEARLRRPTDYAAIFAVASKQLEAIRAIEPASETDLYLHLSPGTPAMAAVWLLLGKTQFPATFLETYEGKSWITDVPFALINLLPDVLHSPDTHLTHLASQSPSEIEGFEAIIGTSRAIREAVGRAKRVAIRSVSVLLLGESGAGKEMFAQAIHNASPRRGQPMRAINCAALSKNLLESELFGHRKGAFTGAVDNHMGAFEAAHGGTVFLDEVGECDLETQAKLLRVLQPLPGEGASIRQVCRLGEAKDRRVDVRIVAATNKDLHQAIREGTFREDLYYRLATVTIQLPPLRARRSDIPKVAQHLLAVFNRQFEAEEPGYVHKSLSPAALTFVKTHDWPGNVRQLYNTLMQASILAEGNVLTPRDLLASMTTFSTARRSEPVWEQPLGDGFNLEEHLNEIRAGFLRRAMEETGGVKARAAKLLGIQNYQTLDAQLKRLHINHSKKLP